MNITTERRANSLCLRFDGELTIYAAAALKTALLDGLAAAAETELELDLAGITAIDTVGVQLLMATKRAAADAGTPLHLLGHSAAALELFELYDLAGWFGDPLVLSAVPTTQQGAAA